MYFSFKQVAITYMYYECEGYYALIPCSDKALIYWDCLSTVTVQSGNETTYKPNTRLDLVAN